MKSARCGELVAVGSPEKLLEHLNAGRLSTPAASNVTTIARNPDGTAKSLMLF
jgi:hypothetical protein